MPARYETIKRSIASAAFACLVASIAAAETPAIAAGAALRTVVGVGVRADYSESRGKTSRHEALVLKTQLTSALTKRRVSRSILVEYRIREDGRRMLLAGGLFDFTRARWTVAASPFYQWPFDGGAGRWLYWGNVRRRLAPRQSIGFEVYGSVATGKPSKWLLAYSGTVSRSVTVSFAVGAGVESGPDLATRTIVTWKLGGRR